MKYRKKPIVVDARQCRVPQYIHTANGLSWVIKDSWIVTDPTSGDTWPVRDDIFRKTYEPVEDEEQGKCQSLSTAKN